MKNPGWWSEWKILVLPLSAFLLICKGGFLYIYLVWSVYLANGWKVVKVNPTDKNTTEFVNQLILGIVVCVAATIITICAHIKY